MAIDLLTYEFLKRYVEGSQMGKYAKPRGNWVKKDNEGNDISLEIEYSTGDYVTYDNMVYIVPFAKDATPDNLKTQTFSETKPGTDETKWQKIAGVNATDGGISEGDFMALLSDNLNIQNAESIDDNSFNNIMQKPEAHINDVTWYSKNLDVIKHIEDNGANEIGKIWHNGSTIGAGLVPEGASQTFEIKHGAFASGKGGNAAVFGGKSQAIGTKSFATGSKNIALGVDSFATGSETFAKGQDAFSSGNNTSALGNYSHTEGQNTKAKGNHSHAEGRGTKAIGNASHSEGGYTTASGERSHAEGNLTVSSGVYSHAEGNETRAEGNNSHAEGFKTIAGSAVQHVQGQYNIIDEESKYLHIIGNGTSETNRKNAMTVDWNGNAWFAGDITVKHTNGKEYKMSQIIEALISLNKLQ